MNKVGVASSQQSKVSTLPAGHLRYDAPVVRSIPQTETYDVLSHHTDMRKNLSSVMSQPYDVLDHTDSKHISTASLHLSPHVSPRTSPSTSRQSSYSSLHAIGDTINEEVYETPLDQTDAGHYGKLDHTSHSPEVPSRKISNEYGKLNQPTVYGPSTQQSEYDRLDHTSRPPALPPKRTTIQVSEYGKLDHTGRAPELPQGGPIVQENEYGKLDHSMQHETSQEPQNEYGKLEHSSRVPGLLQRGPIVQENEYGKLDHSVQYKTALESQDEYSNLGRVSHPPEMPPKRATIQENEYGKLHHSRQHARTSEPQSECGKPDYSNTVPELPQRNVLQENEYSHLDHTSHVPEGKENHEKQFSQQDTSIAQQIDHHSQGGNFSASQQTEYGKLSHKPQIPHRKNHPQVHPSHSVPTSTPQTKELPPGYETFKRLHGDSISSSISSYNSDMDDQITDKGFLISDNDTEYSQLNPIAVDNVDPSIEKQTSQQVPATAQPNTSDAPTKPKPKPRNF